MLVPRRVRIGALQPPRGRDELRRGWRARRLAIGADWRRSGIDDRHLVAGRAAVDVVLELRDRAAGPWFGRGPGPRLELRRVVAPGKVVALGHGKVSSVTHSDTLSPAR